MSSILIGDLQIRSGPKPDDPLLKREPQILPDGILEIGKGDGLAWRYLPEGYGPILDSAQALQQLADDLASLRLIALTDADLEAEIAELLATINAIQQAGATDLELAAQLDPVLLAIGLLTSADGDTATAIAAIQTSAANLDLTFATDAQLATAIAQIIVLLPIRSASMPQNPAIGTRWIELDSQGTEIYDQPWVWRGEWQLERLYQTGTGSGRITSTAAPRMDLSLLPVLPGIAGYRLIRAEIKWALEAAGSWSTKLRKITNAATIVDNPPWIVGPAVTTTAKKSSTTPITVPADSLIPVTLCAIEFNATKGATVPDSIFTLSCQWAVVRA